MSEPKHSSDPSPVESELGFACVDTDRARRRGLPEVIFAPGKTAEQIVAIMRSLQEAGQNIFATRVSPEQYEIIRKEFPDSFYHATARAVTLDVSEAPKPTGMVTVVCAGTSDLPVAEEAVLAAMKMGARVNLIADVGVAGLHRLTRRLDSLRAARVLIVVAGMEGALPSVVGGLVDKPIIAVPTSVGYGTHMKGVASLLAMLNSCVPGICVVNIDNGFGAGVAAAMINKLGDPETVEAP